MSLLSLFNMLKAWLQIMESMSLIHVTEAIAAKYNFYDNLKNASFYIKRHVSKTVDFL